MALTERAMQVVQAPLRIVQQATGAGTGELRSGIGDLERRLTAIERKLDAIHDDTQHIRTEQASEQAGDGS